MKPIAAVLAVLSGILSVSLWRQGRHIAALETRIAKSNESAAVSGKQIATLQAERDTLRQAQGLPPAPPVAAAPRKAGAAVADGNSGAAALRAEFAQQLEEKDARIAAAVKARDDMDAQIRELQARIEALTEETERLNHSERQLREQLQSAERRAASTEKDAAGTAQRLEKLEAANRELRRQADEASRRMVSHSKASSEIEELTRRREVYLNNLLRRYREVTDLYRNIAVRTDAPGEDISRIQNAISLAEEDLRQLHALTAQTARLQKSLAAAVK
ncbi:MAG: hypothetical protein SFV51_22365 [Bryobacteraceae bacterium]|nr:hypothetical protein [Bryobacteraceae bacterium]